MLELDNELSDDCIRTITLSSHLVFTHIDFDLIEMGLPLKMPISLAFRARTLTLVQMSKMRNLQSSPNNKRKLRMLTFVVFATEDETFTLKVFSCPYGLTIAKCFEPILFCARTSMSEDCYYKASSAFLISLSFTLAA